MYNNKIDLHIVLGFELRLFLFQISLEENIVNKSEDSWVTLVFEEKKSECYHIPVFKAGPL